MLWVPAPLRNRHVDEPPFPIFILREVDTPVRVVGTALRRAPREESERVISLLGDAGHRPERLCPSFLRGRFLLPVEFDCFLRPVEMAANDISIGCEVAELARNAVPSESPECDIQFEPFPDEEGGRCLGSEPELHLPIFDNRPQNPLDVLRRIRSVMSWPVVLRARKVGANEYWIPDAVGGILHAFDGEFVIALR